MRVTNNMITYNFLNSLNKSLERQNEVQEQLSDGKAIHRPSDDPVKVIRNMRFHTSLSLNEQFTQNVKSGLTWMENTDGALTNLSSIMIRAKELVIQAGSANPPASMQAIGAELDGLINSAIQIANSQVGDRYLFAGQQDKTRPFERVDDTVVFHGDSNKISMPLRPGAVDPDHDGVNVTAEAAFGGTALFDHLIEIKNQILSSNPDADWLSTTGLGYVDADHSKLLNAQTGMGAHMAQFEMLKNMLEADNITITGNVADTEDIDLARAIIDFKTSENVYRAALSVGARIMPASLVDFLR